MCTAAYGNSPYSIPTHVPDKKYYFGRVKFICDGTDDKLVTLSYYNPNQYVSKIIIQKI